MLKRNDRKRKGASISGELGQETRPRRKRHNLS